MTEPVQVSVALPEIVWLAGHPTVYDPDPRSRHGNLRRCLRCDASEMFHALRCEPGLVVHLIDTEDIHADPERYDGSPWAEPQAIVGAHRHWKAKGFTITRNPGPETLHPRFEVCAPCSVRLMETGVLPVKLPAPPPPPRRQEPLLRVSGAASFVSGPGRPYFRPGL